MHAVVQRVGQCGASQLERLGNCVRGGARSAPACACEVCTGPCVLPALQSSACLPRTDLSLCPPLLLRRHRGGYGGGDDYEEDPHYGSEDQYYEQRGGGYGGSGAAYYDQPQGHRSHRSGRGDGDRSGGGSRHREHGSGGGADAERDWDHERDGGAPNSKRAKLEFVPTAPRAPTVVTARDKDRDKEREEGGGGGRTFGSARLFNQALGQAAERPERRRH